MVLKLCEVGYHCFRNHIFVHVFVLCMYCGSNGFYLMVLVLGVGDCIDFEPCTVYNRRHTAEKRKSKGKEIAEPLSCSFEMRMPDLRLFLLISLCCYCFFGAVLDIYQFLLTLEGKGYVKCVSLIEE